MNVEGVKDAKAEYKKNWAWAKYDPAKVTPEKLVEAINTKTRFKASLPESKAKQP